MPSYSQPDPFTQIRGQIIRAGAPVTIGTIALIVVLFLANYFTGGVALAQWLGCAFLGSHVLPPWGVLTYPFINTDFIGVLFACLILSWVGASLERSWGSSRFAVYALACSLISAASVWLGCSLLRDEYAIPGIWLVISPLIITWAALNPGQTVRLYMVLPVPALVLAAIEVGYVYFEYFNGKPVLGLFGLIPCALAYFYAKGNFALGSRGYARRGPDLRMSGASGGRRGPSVLDGSRPAAGPMGWYRSWQERRRLRKLWRDSGFGD